MNDNIFDQYNQVSSEFEESLGERTPEEVAYDNAIIKELKKGRNIIKALKLASKKYPSEALQYNKKTINDIAAHYDYLLNHEMIKDKMIKILKQ